MTPPTVSSRKPLPMMMPVPKGEVDPVCGMTVQPVSAAGSWEQGAGRVTKGAYAVFSNVIAQQSGLGMVSTDNGTMDITGSVLSNNTYGAVAVRGGVTSISNSTIESNTIGAYVRKGGTINLTNVLPDGSAAPAGVQCQSQRHGCKCPRWRAARGVLCPD